MFASLRVAARTPRAAFRTTEFQKLLYHPDQHHEMIIGSTDVLSSNVVSFHHPQRKAKHHIVITPTCTIQNWSMINETNIHLLYEMKERGNQLLKEMEQKHPDDKFQIGGLAFPNTFKQIALHIISKDFESPNIFSKRVWNMFNTPYFVNIENLLQEIKSKGAVELDKEAYSELLNKEIYCPKCGEKFVSSKLSLYNSHVLTCE